MKNSSLYPVLFGILISLVSILVVTAASQHASASVGSGDVGSGNFGSGNIGSGNIGSISSFLGEAENATMAGTTNQTTTNGNATDAQFLSIQRAQSGSLSEINATAYTLELNNISDKTALFSDRPERIVTTVSTNDFVGNWSKGPDSFELDAPNDALIVEGTQTGQLETAIVESFNPVYDTATNTLTYTVMAENGTSMNMPSQFGQTILVIDDTQNRGDQPGSGDASHAEG